MFRRAAAWTAVRRAGRLPEKAAFKKEGHEAAGATVMAFDGFPRPKPAGPDWRAVEGA